MEDSKRYFGNASRKLERKNAMDWVAETTDIDYCPRGHSGRQRKLIALNIHMRKEELKPIMRFHLKHQRTSRQATFIKLK